VPTTEASSTQSEDAVADAIKRLTELSLEIKDALQRIANAVQTLAASGGD
jgi:hypothetical protein